MVVEAGVIWLISVCDLCMNIKIVIIARTILLNTPPKLHLIILPAPFLVNTSYSMAINEPFITQVGTVFYIECITNWYFF
jgi:hypothetical protein